MPNAAVTWHAPIWKFQLRLSKQQQQQQQSQKADHKIKGGTVYSETGRDYCFIRRIKWRKTSTIINRNYNGIMNEIYI